MKELEDKFRNALVDLIKLIKEPETEVAEVISVEEASCTVKIVTTGEEMNNVRLRATIDGKDDGILIKPVTGSFIFVSVVNGAKVFSYASQFTEIESFYLKNESGRTFKLDDLMRLNGDNLGGLIMIEKLVDKMNKIEEAFTQHVHTASSFGSPTTTPQKADQTPSILINTTKGQIENTKVKHGDN